MKKYIYLILPFEQGTILSEERAARELNITIKK